METREITLHGHRVTYRTAGEGPPLALLHGITSSSETWEPVFDRLARNHELIAPDMLGHGESAKPRGDYSPGAYAAGVRDLLAALGHDHVTIVGHSMGGGVAMQFAYMFPERCQRLVLVSSGGFGKQVTALLRAASLPGSEFVLPTVCNGVLLRLGSGFARLIDRLPLPGRIPPAIREVARSYAALTDAQARAAFLHTLRSVVDARGQRVDATDRLYLAEELPTLIVWGDKDGIIPVDHAYRAHEMMPGSELELMEGSGHFPHHDEPVRFVSAVEGFISSTRPARLELSDLRSRLLAGEDALRAGPLPDAATA